MVTVLAGHCDVLEGSTGEPVETDDDPTETDDSAPGFDVTVALVGLLAAVMVALRRQS
ncbi:PGF-CTERM sorting domain-containing protein [Natrialba swarupiae]|uniref:PGF-CTERM sorting domain-containing protein n=1 Tax=Natrialba swarupiae TaxID=2448032 RepID=A0A5D5APN3_9EURY|nr:PGF-CTERM sorting domain-containing protein [Natrialba swarupiae]MCW8172998.1 PGF-CTERM sorting domain-containing protein [Natrialba swarupiae]TYT62845.1 PGF-CTERM sorting domain-containing protein [Natrialba swarupiae]